MSGKVVEQESGKTRLTVVIPTRNEAPNIAPLLARLAAALAGTAVEYLFVDDSTDDTAAVIGAQAENYPLRLIVRPPAARNGLSGAVVAGFDAATSPWVCVMDADLQHPPEFLPQLLARAEETAADMVVGSRKGTVFGPQGLSRGRAFTSQMLTVLARTLFPRLLKNVSDPLTGLFLVRRTAVDTTLLRPDGFKILLEILVRCPDLRVTECHFDFAPRHGGSSKADVREGIRYFRHLLRLRLTANGWFVRYGAARLGGLLLNLGLLLWIAALLPGRFILPFVLATEIAVLANFLSTEFWVFPDWDPAQRGLRARRFLLVNQLFLLLRLPLFLLLTVVWGLPLLLGALLAIVVVGMVKYGASEQWVWNKGLSWQRPSVYYQLHDLLSISSQVPLPELAHFRVRETPAHVDIQLRVDRHGTPTAQPGAIHYSEGLARFGFSVSIMRGKVTEIVVSPALERAPYALYKSILEPVLRWELVQREALLLNGAAAARDGDGILLIDSGEGEKTAQILSLAEAGAWQFLADDFTILTTTGRLCAYPRPLTMSRALQTAAPTAGAAGGSLRARLKLLFYSTRGREWALRLSERRFFPAATINIYFQRLLAPPKFPLSVIMPQAVIANQVTLRWVVSHIAADGTMENIPVAQWEAELTAVNDAARGFPPYALLVDGLGTAVGESLSAAERRIIGKIIANYQQSRTQTEKTDREEREEGFITR